MTRYGMVIDLSRCIGCNACSMACKQQNGTPPGVWWAGVKTTEVGKFPHTKIEYRPTLCMHCKNAPCVEVCPTGATSKQANGIVAVDPNMCIGCRYCMAACPYNARAAADIKSYYPGLGFTPYEQVMYKNQQTGTVEKCNFCKDLVAKGEEPACVKTCPAYARFFGDLDDPNSEVSILIAQKHGYQLLPEMGTEPSVYYLPA